MAGPVIEVLGVYRLRVTQELVDEQRELLYPSLSGEQRAAAEAKVRAQLEAAVLIELLVRHRDMRFTADDFTQRLDGVPRKNWQAAWAEAFLSPDGTELAVERWGDMPKAGDLRIAFFMHFWNADTPLASSYGDIPCPAPAPMLERLKTLVPYFAVD